MRHFFIVLFLICSLCVHAQNSSKLIAKASPINTEISIHTKMLNPSEDLYEDMWTNTAVHPYNGLTIPESYNIDISRFAMPLKSESILVTSNYGYRSRFKHNHNGIDLNCHTGDTIYAVFCGKIRMTNFQKSGYGNVIVIRHFNGLETVYGHLSKILVKENSYVNEGDPIGLGGNTGRSFGSHLHLETRFCGIAIDPAKIFNFKYQDAIGDNFMFSNKKQNIRKR